MSGEWWLPGTSVREIAAQLGPAKAMAKAMQCDERTVYRVLSGEANATLAHMKGLALRAAELLAAEADPATRNRYERLGAMLRRAIDRHVELNPTWDEKVKQHHWPEPTSKATSPHEAAALRGRRPTKVLPIVAPPPLEADAVLPPPPNPPKGSRLPTSSPSWRGWRRNDKGF